MPEPAAVTVVTTSAFDGHIGKYLTKPEVEALQLYLADNPAAGEPLNEEFPELLAVEWGKNPAIYIEYLVSEGTDTIYLLAVVEHGQEALSAGERRKVKNLLRHARRVGLGVALKALWDLLMG